MVYGLGAHPFSERCREQQLSPSPFFPSPLLLSPLESTIEEKEGKQVKMMVRVGV